MVDELQYNMTSGIFLILANDSPVNEEAEYRGFFVRDSDPQAKTESNADLLLERGNKRLSHNLSISLDSAWSTDFHFTGNGNRDADNFFTGLICRQSEYQSEYEGFRILGKDIYFGRSLYGQPSDDHLFSTAVI